MVATVTRARRAQAVEQQPRQARLTEQQARAKVDRLAEIEARGEQVRAAIAKKVAKEEKELGELADEAAALREELLGHASEGLGSEESTVVLGTAHLVEVGKCRMRTELVDKELLRKFVEKAKKGAFFELCTFPIGQVRKYLTQPQVEQVLSEQHDGPRSFSLKRRPGKAK